VKEAPSDAIASVNVAPGGNEHLDYASDLRGIIASSPAHCGKRWRLIVWIGAEGHQRFDSPDVARECSDL
jgi:hypothetical protein